MNFKKIIFSAILMLCGLTAFSQEAKINAEETAIRNIINSKDFRVDIINAIRQGEHPLAIYATNYMEVKSSKIKAKFPYFYRSDDPLSTVQSDIKLNTDIDKIKIKEKKKEGYFDIKITTHNKNTKYGIALRVGYDGYCSIKVTQNKDVTVYEGRLKTKNYGEETNKVR